MDSKDYFTTCDRCGKQFKNSGFGKHYISCKRRPSKEKMVAMLNQDTTLSASGIAKKYKIGIKQVYDHLEGTEWNRERLVKRGNNASRIKKSYETKKKYNKIYGSLKCPICEILMPHDRGICKYCESENKYVIITREFIDLVSPVK
jgi:hypothetical protein